MDKKEYFYWLMTLIKMGSRKLHDMLEVFHTPEDIFRMPSSELCAAMGYREKTRDYIEASKRRNWMAEYQALEKKEVHFVLYFETRYPKRLLSIYDYPIGLFYMGQLPEDEPSVSIIGARECSRYGKILAEQIGKELAFYKIPVISGMARGIDAAGQEGALRAGGKSFAVLGCGPDICYPSENRELYEELKTRGGIISEFPPNMSPQAFHFPMRNRLISALSDVVLVVEARKKSGTLITVDCALEQGREVYAVPGRVTDELSQGCLELIKNGAGVFINTEKMLSELSIMEEKPMEKEKKDQIILAETEKMVYSELDLQPKSIQYIIDVTRLDIKTVMQTILSLELKGLVEPAGLNGYARTKRNG